MCACITRPQLFTLHCLLSKVLPEPGSRPAPELCNCFRDLNLFLVPSRNKKETGLSLTERWQTLKVRSLHLSPACDLSIESNQPAPLRSLSSQSPAAAA